MSKLLDDAKAAGFHISGDDAFIIVYEPCNNVNITKELAKFAALQQPLQQKETALEKYNALIGHLSEPDPIERLRFFLSLSLKGQDWLDVEKFIDDLQIPDGYKLVPIEFNINVKALLFNQKYGSPSCQKRVVKLCICNGCITDRLEAMLDASPTN